MIHEAEPGTSFYGAVNELKEILRKEKSKDRQMKFNDITFWVSEDSNTNDIATIYDLKRELLKYKK